MSVPLLVAVALGCGDPPPSKYPTKPLCVDDGAVGPADLLEIRVAKQDQLSGEFEVDTNGVLSFPYVGIVESTGKTPIQIQSEIQTRLADGYLRDPQVMVRVKERRSKKISVFGEVKKGSTIPFTDRMTIVQAISEAGGFSPRAWENAVKVTRKAPAGSEEYTVPVKQIASGRAASFSMCPGDSVYVPKSPL
jgi:protein involved in polysaccharide export with SLBB domain